MRTAPPQPRERASARYCEPGHPPERAKARYYEPAPYRMKAAMRFLFPAFLALSVACSSAASPSPEAPVASGDASTVHPSTPSPGGALWPEANTPSHVAARPITFPQDDGPHEALTEWWYYNGHLQGEDGQAYGFELVVFKRQPRSGRAGHAAHVAITDHRRREFQFAEDLSLPPPSLPNGEGFAVSAGKIAARGVAGRDTIQGTTTDYQLDLELRAVKPPVLHGETGYIGVASSELSYYYSRPRMTAVGTLRDRGTSVAVTGQAWMDHQWGDFSLQGGGGWDWYSVQLEDGTDLMVSVVRNDRHQVVLAYATLVGIDGSAVHLPGDRLRAASTGEWTSPATGVSYPMGWALQVPDRKLELQLEAVMPEQEMVTTASVNAVYWEGQVTVSGSVGEQPARGMGYVELTGYGAAGARPSPWPSPSWERDVVGSCLSMKERE